MSKTSNGITKDQWFRIHSDIVQFLKMEGYEIGEFANNDFIEFVKEVSFNWDLGDHISDTLLYPALNLKKLDINPCELNKILADLDFKINLRKYQSEVWLLRKETHRIKHILQFNFKGYRHIRSYFSKINKCSLNMEYKIHPIYKEFENIDCKFRWHDYNIKIYDLDTIKELMPSINARYTNFIEMMNNGIQKAIPKTIDLFKEYKNQIEKSYLKKIKLFQKIITQLVKFHRKNH